MRSIRVVCIERYIAHASMPSSAHSNPVQSHVFSHFHSMYGRVRDVTERMSAFCRLSHSLFLILFHSMHRVQFSSVYS